MSDARRKNGSQKNSRGMLIVLAAGALIAIAVAAVLLWPKAKSSPQLDDFAKCLTEKKAIMYGSSICPHCEDQKQLFGESFKHVQYVECLVPGSKEPSPGCKWAGVKQVPTWIFGDGQRRVGIAPLAELSSKTGCALP